MPRSIEFILSAILTCIALPAGLAIAAWVRLDSPGDSIHWSSRIGRHGRPFSMPKFRTMRVGTPQVATDRLSDPGIFVTRAGRWLRRTSLDELPQLWSVLRGDMALVGPRPALYTQEDLIAARKALGIDSLRPGVTGWAQVNGRDEVSEQRKVELDQEYLARRSFVFDLRIVAMTVLRVLRSDGIAH